MNHTPYTSRRSFLRFAAHSSAALAATGVAPAILGRITSAQAAETEPATAIINPRFVNPAYAEPGGSFSAEVRGDAGLDPAGWTAALENDLHVSWPCKIENARYGDVNNGREPGWQLTIRVPSSISPELMHLQLSHRAGQTSQTHQAVSIVTSLNDPFFMLHLTDEHVMRERQEQIQEASDRKTGFRTAQLVTWATPVVNLINPRLVVNSGDQVTRFATTGYQYDLIDDIYGCYRKAKRGYRVPSMVVLGNHDVNQRADRTQQYVEWERVAGQRYYTIRIGSLAIFGNDYTDNQSKRWILDTYAATYNNPEITGRVVVQHFTDWAAVRIPDATPATLELIGHLHNATLVESRPFPILMSVAAHRYARAGWIGFERNNQGQWTTHAADNWKKSSFIELVSDNGTPNVWMNYDTPNDGQANSNRVVISNRLNQNFADGRVRLLMADGNYAVQGGDVLSSYTFLNKSGQRRRAVLVRVNIAANSTTTVSIQPSGTSIASVEENAIMQPVEVNTNGVPLDIMPEYKQPATPAAMDGGSTPTPSNFTQRVWMPIVGRQ